MASWPGRAGGRAIIAGIDAATTTSSAPGATPEETPGGSEDDRGRVLTGFRPTGPLHIGHWAGNVGNAVRLQEEGYECFYFVADWHMLTTDYDRTDQLSQRVRGLAADLIASGIDPQRSVLYRQSDLPEVAEMALLLGMITPLGWLERVPTYKERLRDLAERDISNLGLLAYPVLQTVDITIVQGRYVPVGEDQVSHLEISREIVRRFNRLYDEVLIEPQALLSETPMIPGSDGRKMSKSLDNTIDLQDDPDRIRAKVRSFITDPQKIRRGDPGRPEICPIFALQRRFSPEDAGRIEQDCRSGALGCVDCKTILADHLIEELAGFRERRAELEADPGYLDQVLRDGVERARPVVGETMRTVRAAMGFAGGSS